MKKFLLYSILVLNIVAVAGLLSSYLSVYIPPNKIWVLAFVGLSYPYILALNFAFVILWLFLKWKYAFLSLLGILIGFQFIPRFFQFAGKKSNNTDIKILSYNVRHFSGDGNEDSKANAEKIITFLEEQNADIICLQESRLRRNNIFNLAKTVKDLKNIQHYQFASSSSSFGSVTMTRYPIVDMGEIRFEKSTNITIFTDVKIENDTIRIYNLHLQSYQIAPENYSVIESLDLQEEKNRRVFRKVASQMKQAFSKRAAQVEEIRRHIESCPYPVIVCGDFNDTPTSYSYHVLSEDLKDAFVESGHGVGQTYAGQLPSFRIDYILHSPRLEAYNFETIDFVYSDHLPVTCDFILADH